VPRGPRCARSFPGPAPSLGRPPRSGDDSTLARWLTLCRGAYDTPPQARIRRPAGLPSEQLCRSLCRQPTGGTRRAPSSS
jgi:hypothetical protein